MDHAWWSLFVAAGLLLAGCTAPAEGPGEGPPDGGVNGSDGSDGPGGSGSGGAGFAPQTGAAEDKEEGLHLWVTMRACEAGFCLHGVAKNEGSDTYHVSNICVSPFSDAMHREGVRVQPREPMAHCEAFGTKPFGPGASMEADFTWDQRLWDEEAERLVDAPEGAYQWSMAFEAYREAGGGDRLRVDANVTVIVGET